jgi:acyl dehydratase
VFIGHPEPLAEQGSAWFGARRLSIAPATVVAGPYYDDLEVGQIFDAAPALTLTDAHAVLHQAITGGRLRLALDADLCGRVCGPDRRLAHPALVCDVAIGQSTLATQRVMANLFYRGLVFRRAPRIGDTLRTSTEVVALRDTSAKPGRPPSGLAALRIRTVDALGRAVLDFYRCAMLPMRDESCRPGHTDDLDAISPERSRDEFAESVITWDLDAYRALVPLADDAGAPKAGMSFTLEGGDTVTAGPELVRMTLNIASVHLDPAAGGRGRRLVYGGHTIGVGLGHVTRVLPNLVTVVGWRSCDHLAPVFEGDVLHSVVTVEAVDRVADGGVALVDLRVQTDAQRGVGERDAVLDWRLVAVAA